MSPRGIRDLKPVVVFSLPHPSRPGARRWHTVCRTESRVIAIEPSQLEAFQAALNHCHARRPKKRTFGFPHDGAVTREEHS